MMEQREETESNRISLLTLPQEIQIKIFSHLSVPFGKPTIQAVLRTCKQLYEVALPVSVSVFRNAVHSVEGSGACSQARNTQFLRYILILKPWLAKHVRTIVMGSFSSNDGRIKEDQNTTANEDLAIYEQHITCILGQLPSANTTSWCAEWVEDLKKNTSDAQVALILFACPNIQTLLYEMPNQARNFLRLINMVHNLMAINTSVHPQVVIPLSNILDVYQETADFTTAYSEFYVEAPEFFSFPQLRFYGCVMAYGPASAAARFKSLPYKSSPVQEITLHYSFVCAETLQGMLASCRALKKFDFTHAELHNAPDLIMPRDILEAILPHTDTLEDLYLNIQENSNQQRDQYPDRLYMGVELRQMKALRRLTVSMQALTGIFSSKSTGNTSKIGCGIKGAPRIINCLPGNLEYLKIHHCEAVILDQAEELIKVVEHGHCFEKLNYIGLLFNDSIKEEDKIEIRKLRCDTAQVCLELIFQTQETCRLDFGLAIQQVDTSTSKGRHLMSRIYAQHVRRRYLEARGNSSYSELDFKFDDPTSFDE